MLCDCLLMCIAIARNDVDLAQWWGKNQPGLKQLDPAELARVVEAKNVRLQGWRLEVDRLNRRR